LYRGIQAREREVVGGGLFQKEKELIQPRSLVADCRARNSYSKVSKRQKWEKQPAERKVHDGGGRCGGKKKGDQLDGTNAAIEERNLQGKEIEHPAGGFPKTPPAIGLSERGIGALDQD